MQTTLLTAAIALILALVAALVGPLLVDWGTYRPLFEAQASRLVGLPVVVKGRIDARLLPSPQLTLHDIEIGGETIRARAALTSRSCSQTASVAEICRNQAAHSYSRFRVECLTPPRLVQRQEHSCGEKSPAPTT